MTNTSLTRRLLFQLFLQVLFQLTTAEDSCPASGKGSLYSNLPEKYRMQGLLIVHYILSNEKVGSLDACGEKCKGDTKSKSCAYYPNGRICYLFSEKFDDIGIALQLNYGWQHISIEADGIFVIREKHLPCNHDYCEDTCLPGYTTKCFAGLSGPKCDKYDGVYESCLQYETMKTYGKEPGKKINTIQMDSHNFPVFLPFGGKTIEMSCWFGSDRTRFQCLAPENFEYPKSYTVIPYGAPRHHKLTFSLPDDAIKSFLANRNCKHRIDIKTYGLGSFELHFLGSDGRKVPIDEVPGCSACKSHVGDRYWERVLYINDQSFIPVQEIILSEYLRGEWIEVVNYYLACPEQ